MGSPIRLRIQGLAPGAAYEVRSHLTRTFTSLGWPLVAEFEEEAGGTATLVIVPFGDGAEWLSAPGFEGMMEGRSDLADLMERLGALAPDPNPAELGSSWGEPTPNWCDPF